MKRNLKTLGLTLGVTVALGAVITSIASANTSHNFASASETPC